jgi:hypothetical protein
MKKTSRILLFLILCMPLNHCDWGLLPVAGDSEQDVEQDQAPDGQDTDIQVDRDADVPDAPDAPDTGDDGTPGDPDADTEVLPACGNNTVEEGETCDPPSSCPTDCEDGDPCTVDTLIGSAEECTADCLNEPITECLNDDGCCPAACNSGSDNDCSASCGNEVVDPGETCDPPATCPTDCNDGDPCTDDTLTGSAANCNADCPHAPVTDCLNGDGCCPGTCNSINDNDCSPACDNGVVESGETCDPVSMCPTSCDDGNPCSIDVLQGEASNCTSYCEIEGMVSDCLNGDGCCPSACNSVNDNDCSASCGNGVVESGEECDFSSDFCVSCHFAAPSGWTSCTDSSGNHVYVRTFNPGSNQTWAQARDYCATTITGLNAQNYDYLGLVWFTDANICTCVGPLLSTSRQYYIGLVQSSSGSEPSGGWYWTASPDGSTWSNVGNFTSGTPCILGDLNNAGGSGQVDCGRLSPPRTFSDYGCDSSSDWDPICMVQF